MNNRHKAYLALLANTITWGLAPPIIKYSLDYTTPAAFLTLRLFLVCVILLPFFIKKVKKHPFDLKDLPILLLSALCGTSLHLGFYFLGISRTSAIQATIIFNTSPLIIVFLGWLLFGEKITKKEKTGLIFALIGTALTTLAPVINGEVLISSGSFVGNLLILLSTFSWIAYSLINKKNTLTYPNLNINYLSFVVGFITFLPIYLLQDNTPLLYFHPQALPGILYMVFFGTIIAYLTYTYGFSLIEASEATLFTYLQPVFTIPLSVLWLNETLNTSFIFGSIFVAIGVFLTEYKPKKVAS
jgi:drug/metabolite transporter (DMT)-like permease